MNKALLILGGGALLYWWYSQNATATPVTAAPVAGSTPPVNANTAPSGSASPSVQQRAKIVAAINSSGVSSTYVFGQQGVDTWNWYAMQAFPGYTAPTPESLYPGVPNVHSKTFTFDDWFSRIQSSLPTTGLSGLAGYQIPQSRYFGPGGWFA